MGKTVGLRNNFQQMNIAELGNWELEMDE